VQTNLELNGKLEIQTKIPEIQTKTFFCLDCGIKVLTHQKKTPPHFENAQNAPKKKQQKKCVRTPKKHKLSSDALKNVFNALQV
jgi:hypothetical protein